MRIAVIDLGTNTCNLLVAEMQNSTYRILHQSKELVKLGDDKIRDNEISGEATSRAVEAFTRHIKVVNELEASKLRAIATSAVRSADNKIDFLDKIGEDCGCLVKVVTGEREAELIFEGVLLAFGEFKEPSVILDIGGGSNELILAQGKEMLWKESQPAGMARVIHALHLSDPVKDSEVAQMQDFFIKNHGSAFNRCKTQNVQTLVGCSGAFDTVADLIDGVNAGEKQRVTQEISLADFYEVYEILKKSTREERLNMKGMDLVRVDLIVPAVILIEKLIAEIGIKKIVQTDFALREGVLYEIMNNSKVR